MAVEHGFFNESGFLSGLEDIGNAVATLVDAAPDAIQLTEGQKCIVDYPDFGKARYAYNG